MLRIVSVCILIACFFSLTAVAEDSAPVPQVQPAAKGDVYQGAGGVARTMQAKQSTKNQVTNAITNANNALAGKWQPKKRR